MVSPSSAPFHHYIGGQPLGNGFQWTDAGILAMTAAVPVALGALSFGRPRRQRLTYGSRVRPSGPASAGRSLWGMAG